jgi:lysophospholipase L1-like esterase
MWRRSGRDRAGLRVVLQALVLVLATGAWVHPAAAAPSGPPTVVAMGDSMISGVAGRWFGNSLSSGGSRGGTDRACNPIAGGGCAGYDPARVYVENSYLDACDRSDVAEIHSAQIPGVQAVSLACAGALTYNLLPAADGGVPYRSEVPEVDQLAALAQTHDVRLIVVAVGINDMHYVDTILGCIDAYQLRTTCLATQQRQAQSHADATLAGIEAVVRSIRVAMSFDGYASSDYRLILQSYPSLIGPAADIRYPMYDMTRDLACPITNADATWLHDSLIPQISSIVQQAAASTGAEFLDLKNLFDGHELCSKYTSLANAGTGNPPSMAGSEWGRFLDFPADTVQGAEPGVNPNVLDNGLGEAYHPNAFGQMAQGSCLRLLAATTPGNNSCLAGPGVTQPHLVRIGSAPAHPKHKVQRRRHPRHRRLG